MPAPHNASDSASILGPTLRFKGELSAREDLVIHGQVEGTIGPAPKVTIGPEAHVKAAVTADVIVIEGEVDGDMKALVSITLVSITVRSKANVRGNLEAPTVNIAEGATFNGGIKMEPSRAEASHVRTVRTDEPSVIRTGTAY
jgi:cytoskeletal protein CcmA (bactofilin family)